ncbi:pyrroline-5-carboxylate reductase family protein [Hydrogenophaga sp.]|uniref:pyrroline-5-carboxylate reductase family protein n=1 Tax=Hydrogenophaga sp. TaxID=1904254 RepID=UPI003F70D456
MGGPIASAMLSSELIRPDQLTFVASGPSSLDKLRKSFPQSGHRLPFEKDQGGPPDMVFLGSKPSGIGEVGEQLKTSVANRSRALLFSIMAGVSPQSVAQATGVAPEQVVWAMPNQGALVERSATGLYAPPGVSAEHRDMAEHIARSFGSATWVESPEHMHGVTACAGSGIGFVFHHMRALETEAIQSGMAPDAARAHAVGVWVSALKDLPGTADLNGSPHDPLRYMAAMIRGAQEATGLHASTATSLVVDTAQSAIEVVTRDPHQPLEERIRAVTSPNGTTAAGLSAMAGRHDSSSAFAAVLAAAHRSVEMQAGSHPATKTPLRVAAAL